MPLTRKHRRIHTSSRQARRRGGHEKAKIKERSAGTAAHGFLNHSFYPVAGRKLALLGHSQAIEQSYFASLHNLGKKYGLKIAEPGMPYPYNIAASFDKAKEQLLKVAPEATLVIIKDEKTGPALATVKTYDTGYNLYYIAMQPLLQLLSDKKRRKEACLLCSVFAYLFQVLNLPSFMEEGVFLSDTYEMIEQWYEQDEHELDPDFYREIKSELALQKFHGDKIQKSIRHPYHLSEFENRVKAFHPVTEPGKELLSIAEKFLNLYQQYGKKPIYANMNARLVRTEEEDYIRADQYISFCWSYKGSVYEQLLESVNLSFQEMAYIEEPHSVQVFSEAQPGDGYDLGFETKAFDCIASLIDYLSIE